MKYEVIKSKKSEYKFEYACAQSGHTEVLFVDVINPNRIDCMGSEVSVHQFCEGQGDQQLKLLRGYADPKGKRVFCHYGEQVRLSLLCDRRDRRKFCKTAEFGCGELKKLFAREIPLIHKSLISDRKEDLYLNCYFALEAKEIDLNMKDGLPL